MSKQIWGKINAGVVHHRVLLEVDNFSVISCSKVW